MTSSRGRAPGEAPTAATGAGPVAVIGASGFLGSALVRRATREGIGCTSFTRSTPFLDRDGAPAPGLTTAHTIYWLAGTINPALAESEPHRAVADHAAFTSLLHATRRMPHRPRVVLASSGGTVYDSRLPPPYTETSPTAPRSAYGRAKLELERLLATELAPEQAVALRVANAYGPRQPARRGQGVVAHWLRAVARGEPIVVIGDPGSTRDYVYIDDIVDSFLAVHRAVLPLPPTLNIGAGQPTALGDLAELVQKVIGAPGDLVYQPARGFDVSHNWLDVRLAERRLGWHPRTDLRTGLSAAWQACRESGPIR